MVLRLPLLPKARAESNEKTQCKLTFKLGCMVRMPGVRIRSARMVGPGWLIGTLRGGPGNGPTSIQVTVSKTLARIL